MLARVSIASLAVMKPRPNIKQQLTYETVSEAAGVTEVLSNLI